MRFIVIVLSVGLLSSCSFDKEKEKKEIMELLFHQVNDWNSGDIESYMQAYWKSDQLRFASGARVTYGWQKTFKNYKKAYPSKLEMGKLVFSDFQIKIMDNKNAIVFGRWQLFRDTDVPNGLFTLNLYKFPEGWRIISDHTSSAK